MKQALPLIFLFFMGALIAAARSPEVVLAMADAQQPAATAAKTTTKLPPPIVVEIMAVDPKAKTITVREIAAVPAPPGKPVEITLPVPATATGEKVGNVKVGEKVAVTCTVKPTVHPAAGAPVVITDCLRVVKLEKS